ncbi:MAG: hypothetical protein RBQ94_01820 [Methanimicrococcus sp.]|nr:hypothetical protein [Methanimicrococcus sp.]
MSRSRNGRLFLKNAYESCRLKKQIELQNKMQNRKALIVNKNAARQTAKLKDVFQKIKIEKQVVTFI